MLPLDWNNKFDADTLYSGDRFHQEYGKRGRARFRVTFDVIGPYSIDIWFGPTDKYPAKTSRDEWYLNKLKPKRSRGEKKAKKILMPVIEMWANSNFRYTINLQDFVTNVLGKLGHVKRGTPK